MNLTQDTLEGGVFPKAKSTESSQYGTYTPSKLRLQQLSLVLYKTSGAPNEDIVQNHLT